MNTEEQQQHQAIIDYDIDVIAASPFGKTNEGKRIVGILRSLNKGGNVVYGSTLDDSRGEWDGQTITVNEDFRKKMFHTILELVHEASHARWRQYHPKDKETEQSDQERRKANVDDELTARDNQLLVYSYLKKEKGCPVIQDLERRLERKKEGKLRETIEKQFD